MCTPGKSNPYFGKKIQVLMTFLDIILGITETEIILHYVLNLSDILRKN